MDMACLDPSIFEEIVIKGLPDGALKSISSFLPTLGIDAAKNELMSFARNFDKLKMSLVEYSNEAMILIDQIDVLEDDKEDKEGFYGEFCRSYPNCALLVLASYRLNDMAYDNLYQVYKVLCALSITQVACERSFSKLKIIKTRLRNSMTSDHLESYMILSIEKTLFNGLISDDIIRRYARTSSELSRLLDF